MKRIILSGGGTGGHIYPAVFGQAAHQVLDTQNTGAYVASEVFFCFLYDVGKNFFSVSFRYKTET